MSYPDLDTQFDEVIESLKVYLSQIGSSLDNTQEQLASECLARLRRLKRSYKDIVEKTTQLLELGKASGKLPSSSEMIQLLEKNAKTNPEVAQLLKHLGPNPREVHSESVSATILDYDEQDEKNIPEAEREIIYYLVDKVSDYYYGAARLLKTLQKLPGLKKLDSAPVRNVRNKLLEHPEDSDSGVLMNSFGYSKNNGPVVKAMRSSDKADVFLDKGLVPNTKALLDDLVTHVQNR
ncbi:MAG TPA: hypothetical protein VMR34_04720 [Candidatus Saccharimonadales bacterium]|nr:hypothetical protein [Candidatus Saccharimonadales bacterium]